MKTNTAPKPFFVRLLVRDEFKTKTTVKAGATAPRRAA